MIAIGEVIAVCAAAEELPDVKMLKLDARTLLAVPRQERGKYVVACVKGFEEAANTWQYAFSGSGLAQTIGEPRAVPLLEALEISAAHVDAGAGRRIVEYPLVSSARHLHGVERTRDAEYVFERTIHRTAACTARPNQRSIDIE